MRKLKAEHGALIFHQSGGCCEGSAPMCFAQNDFRAGSADVLLGTIDGSAITTHALGTAEGSVRSNGDIVNLVGQAAGPALDQLGAPAH